MDNKKIGNFISTIRKSLKMTQQEIADKLNITNKAVSKWETGEGYPEITILPALAEILGVSTDELLNGEKFQSPSCKADNTSCSKQYEYLLEKALLKFKNAHIIAIAVALLGIILSFIITFSTDNTGLSILGMALVILSIALFSVNYNNVKNSIEKYEQLCHEKEGIQLRNRNLHRSLILSVWTWMFSTCIITALLLPEKSHNHLVTQYRFHLLFMLGAAIACTLSIFIHLRHRA